ncbi:hypothetical protein OE699_02010 [Sedimentimonas flavescens]|uniref:Lysozyme n=1 Tax=Sedimentimonas flavescens TaxID=2851012 RepID=A0ABT2ZVS4_9RHOB|nr:hypothetical protein [Sedimentimonas flavescens]MCV2877614.1 hypothetical protein [Sedimentimonas flavescens]
MNDMTTPDLAVSIGVNQAALAKQLAAMEKRVLDATKAVEKKAQFKIGGKSAEDSAKALAKEMDTLRAKFDPLFAKSKAYEAKLDDLNSAHKKGAIDAKVYQRALDALNEEYAQGATRITGVERGVRSFGGGLQNIGYQVADFATQVGAGTSAAQALGQQLPQVLGGFGAFGAVAGAAAAVLIPVGAALIKMAFDVETLEEKQDRLTKSTDAYISVAEAAQAPIADLREKYGDLADEIQRTSELQADLAKAVATGSLASIGEKIGGYFGDFSIERAAGLNDSEWANFQSNQMRRLRQETGATAEEADDLRMALRRLETTNGPEAFVRDAENLLQILVAISGGADAAQGKFGELIGALGGAVEDAKRLIEQSRTDAERAQRRLVEQYDADTAKLEKLAGDRGLAEELLAKAIKDGNEEKIASYRRVIAVIREEEQAILESKDKVLSTLDAYRQYGQSRLAGSRGAAVAATGDAVSQIKRYESFRTDAYPDYTIRNGVRVNSGYRIGYGSDEVTLADGSIQKVTQGMTVSISDANRDLVRRVGEFQGGIINTIGQDRWQSFSSEQQGALTSIAYNYGSLPDRIIDAVKSGTNADIADAIGRLSGDNSGLNRDRRLSEASAFGGVSSGLTAELTAQQKAIDEQIRAREDLAKATEKYGQSLLTQIANAEFEASIIGKSAEEQARLRAEYLLTQQAKEQGIDLNSRLAGSEMTVAEAIKAKAAADAQAAVAAEQRKLKEQELQAQLNVAAQAQQEFQRGIVSAIINGENLSSVLANVARRLAEAALQAALFGKMINGQSVGGILSGASNAIGAAFGVYAEGGYTGDGGKYQPMGVVHGGEYVFSKEAVQKIGVPNLDTMHKQLRGYAQGGSVGGASVGVPVQQGLEVIFVDQRDLVSHLARPTNRRRLVKFLKEEGI